MWLGSLKVTEKNDETSTPSCQKRTGREGARVLLLVKDLYASIGGGQTAYRAIIENSPDRQFFYFIEDEAEGAARPKNAVPVPRRVYYRENTGDLPSELQHYYSDYLESWQLARSLVEAFPDIDVDVVDTPDYATNGLFIRGALQMHGVRVGIVSLALHGTISSALTSEWGERLPLSKLAEIRMRERLQYRAADSRYALSAAYADEMARRSGGSPANLIDPLLIVGPFAPHHAAGDGKPDVAFVGRRERRKGPDIFVDALWSVDRQSYGRSLLIGPESKGSSGVGSRPLLEAMAKRRELNLIFEEKLGRAELDELFLTPAIIALPSRYDQFNLVALEALRLGAPAFVSRQAGVARWIDERLPELSDFVFDISGARELAAKLRHGLANYAGLRQRVIEAIAARPLLADARTLANMYAPAEPRCHAAQDAVREIQRRLDSFNRPREHEARQDGRLGATAALPAWKQALINSPLRPAAEAYHFARVELQSRVAAARKAPSSPGDGGLASLKHEISDRSPRSIDQVKAAFDLEGVRSLALAAGERKPQEIRDKLKILSQSLAHTLVGRVSLFAEMARLERKRGADVVAATYAMRSMRWLGGDAGGDLDFTLRTLRSGGYVREAAATEAMFADPARADSRVADLLRKQYLAQMTKDLGVFAILDDRRPADAVPLVSVIVSLYNAESKLDLFLRHAANQSLLRAGKMEFILVDSGSPTNERGAFEAFVAQTPLPAVYARTAARETIQAAWNRGIKLSRGRYLSFLGVDEGVHPDAYAILANTLDENADVDWVMADSVVTTVDKRGSFVADVMTYDRRGYDQGLVYLETCYLSWVGGLYRKSIHDRFGYYDETFRGAGDTEFKSRILPHISSMHVPHPLGLFLNYPEERTTQHPRAEIEDQRAWYMFRTVPGLAYVWDNKPIGAVEDFFRSCLRYRKSYCGHLSTDIDMAHAVALYMVRRAENPEFAAAAARSTGRLLSLIRGLETIDMRLSPAERSETVLRALAAAKRQEAPDAAAFGMADAPRYEIFNDNRYEQHWYSWSA